MREADPGRTLLLLFSDGIDTASWLSAKEVIDAAGASDVVIYPVTVRRARYSAHTIMPGGMRGDDGREMLKSFAEETGGRVFYADSERTLQKTFNDVLDEFKQRYVLSFTPRNVRPGGWHTLEVKVRGNRGQVTAAAAMRRMRDRYLRPPRKSRSSLDQAGADMGVCPAVRAGIRKRSGAEAP